MDPLQHYFNKATQSLFRYEGLQDYTAMDDPKEIQYYIQHGELLVLPQHVTWCKEMKIKNATGIRTARVRMVKKPLNDYTKWELAWHRTASAFSGDDIRVIEDTNLSSVNKNLIPDYWMIDDQFVFLLKYGPHGKYLGSEMATVEDVQKFVEYKKLLMNMSQKIASYLV